LVTTGASTDAGIVVVYPNSGRITFWENVESAESTSLFQRSRQGVEGSLKLLSGEIVVEILDVEHAGYILMLSSGRLAHLTVRDSQGRPSVTAIPMSSDGQSKSGWLGGWYQTLGGGWRNTHAAVKARPSPTRGQMEVVAVTKEGTFKLWDVNWTGQSTFTGQLDASREIRDSLSDAGLAEEASKANIKVMDFAILQSQSNVRSGLDVLVLVAVEDTLNTKYALLQLALVAGNIVQSKRIIPVTVYTTLSSEETPSKVALLLPKPEHTAYIITSSAVVVASLADISTRSASIPAVPFQDVIYFQSEKGAEIIASVAETPSTHSKGDSSSVLVFTNASGSIRVSANMPSTDPRYQRVTAKSKIEQAIFHGAHSESILDLEEIEGFAFPTKELENAALQISFEVLQSESEFISKVSTSMETQINSRRKALRALITYMRKHCSHLSRLTKWRLMWDAERMASARQIWKVYEKRIKEHPDGKRLLDMLVFMLHETNKSKMDRSKGDTDPTRNWLTYDIGRLEKFLPIIPTGIKEFWKELGSNNQALLETLLQSEDLIFAVLETPYKFREEHLKFYGLENEPVEGGVLREGYEGFPEVWTAQSNATNCMHQCVAFFRDATIRLAGKVDKVDEDMNKVMKSLADQHWRLVEISLKTNTERYRLLMANEDEAERRHGQDLKEDFENNIRHKHLMSLADVSRSGDGMKIAEKLHDLPSLVALALNELQYHHDPDMHRKFDAKQKAVSENKLIAVRKTIARYFENFGQEFADTFYNAEIQDNQLAELLEQNYGKPRQLTEFLRSNPAYAKLSWMNDVIAEKDLLQAGKSLMDVAQKQENNAWAKRTELSLAKLALLSDQKPTTANGSLTKRGSQTESPHEQLGEELLKKNAAERTLAQIQDRLYNHVRPIILEAMDEKGARDLFMETYGNEGPTKDRPALNQLLEGGFEELIQHHVLAPDVLIDILTLMGSVPSDNGTTDISGREFMMALSVLNASGLCEEPGSAEYGKMLLDLIWKRLFIRDNWKSVNATKGKSDQDIENGLMETMLFKTLKLGAEECKFAPVYTRVPNSNIIHSKMVLFGRFHHPFPNRGLRSRVFLARSSSTLSYRHCPNSLQRQRTRRKTTSKLPILVPNCTPLYVC
jgi:nuclear pore complex protein Nup133